ncbi:MAG: acetylglutamate kinase [Oscillospiraceae bacterium]|jgi:acetylglutamate kinase|nr:acetylglutamate kinase [Oscillospiraceae bacterium]
MKLSNMDKANVLVQALPYIQDYANKIVVIKYGGSAMVDEGLKQAVMSDLVLLRLVGIKVVLVHGGGPEITKTMEKMGLEPRFIDGLRYTDAETSEVVQMVLAGKTNKDLVTLIHQNRGRAIGLCGLDGGMIFAEKMRSESGEDLGFVGEIKKVSVTPIMDVLDRGYIPVIATLGADRKGSVYNINADTAAAYIAGALGAANYIVMTDIRGLLEDKDDENTLIQTVQVSEVPYLISQGLISGGMIPKVDSCVSAVRRGVSRAIIIDGRIPHSILIEMMTDEGIGTMFY